MTRIIFKMAKNRIPQISLLWVTILLTASSRSENILRIRNLKCFNDFLKNMFCTWEVVNSTTSCHNDFALSYETFDGTNGMCPDLRNEQFGDSVMPNKCICNISVEHFIAGEEYKIKVESKGTSVGNITVPIKSTIKPKAPTNVQIEFLEQDNCLVKWDTGYKSTYITDKLSFQAQIIYKHNREVAREFIQTTPNYLFNKILLNRGESYVVRVRTRHLESRGGWSEWSSEEEWKNDFSHTIPEIMGVIIPVACIVMLCLLVGCYICFTRYKKTWWDTIPSPAKSTFVKKKLIQKHRTFPDRNTTSRKSCGSFFSKIVKAHKFKCDQLTQQDTARQYVLGIVKSDCKKCIFEPKNEDVERCIEMYPKMEDESNPVQEDKATHETEDQPLEDLSIADMFFAILRDSSGIKVDTFDNFNAGLFGCPSLMGSFDKEEKDWLNLNDSGHSTLGYRNSSSDDFPLDSSSSIDMINMPCFDHWIDNEIDCMHYTPKGSIKKNYTYQCKGDCLTSSCYNSFANALSDAKKDFITDTTKTFCLDNFSQSAVLTKANIYQLHLCPKGSLYYNTKHQPNIKSKSGQIILQCQEGKTDPISKYQVLRHQSFDQRQTDLGCHMSGYKSFDQAVKQGDETSVSGYQSFDQAVQQGDETSVGGYQSFNQAVQQGDKECVPQVNGYQSFDQAVQESETEFGCSISGYKCFDRAVEEGIATSVCEVNGYRSFDQAVQESEPKFVCTISGYKAFDQAVEERVATSVSEVNGYQSFDQAIKESEPEFGCNISGYKSFDQAVEEGVATSVSEVNGYQSFDQAIKESEPEFGCNISGYKSFGQAVEEGVAASMCKVNGYQSFDQAVKENEPEFGCSTSGYKSFGHAVEEGVATSLREVNGYKSFNQAIQESDTSGSSTCISVDSGYKSFDNLVCQNNDYSNRNGCKCKNNQYKNKTDFNSGEYKLISSGSMELKYSDCVKATMEKYPSFSDQPFKALRIAVGSNHTNDMALKHEETPLRLTFDIGEHLRNLENKHWHKLPLDNLETATIPFNHQIFPCHLDKVLFNQNQLINNKYRILHKCPLTIYNSEDMSMFKPLCDLDVMDSSEMNKHLLIQQSSLDKDGNSYMKIK